MKLTEVAKRIQELNLTLFKIVKLGVLIAFATLLNDFELFTTVPHPGQTNKHCF